MKRMQWAVFAACLLVPPQAFAAGGEAAAVPPASPATAPLTDAQVRFRSLALYGAGSGGARPASDKGALADELADLLAKLERYCADAGVDLGALEDCTAKLERLEAVLRAADSLLLTEDMRKGFLAQQRLAQRLYSALKPHKSAAAFATRVATLTAIGDKIREATAPELQDIDEVMREQSDLVETIARFDPRIVKMCDDGSRAED